MENINHKQTSSLYGHQQGNCENGENEQPFTYKDMGGFIMQKAAVEIKDFSLLDSIKPVIMALCYYFTGDLGFEKLNPEWKLYKGLYLWGNVGVGKTTIMRLFQSNPRRKYNVVNCRRLVSDFLKDGYPGIGAYSFRLTAHSEEPKGVCFDDLGVENEAVLYGNRTNVMENILLDRYDNRVPFEQTHLTTNLSAEDIEQRYGSRVRSRMREMFNLIELHGSDLRK